MGSGVRGGTVEGQTVVPPQLQLCALTPDRANKARKAYMEGSIDTDCVYLYQLTWGRWRESCSRRVYVVSPMGFKVGEIGRLPYAAVYEYERLSR